MGFIATTNSGFESNARRELRNIYGDDAEFAKSFFKGVLIVNNKDDISLLKDNSLIAKAVKFEKICTISKSLDSLHNIEEAISLDSLKGKKIQVKCKRRGEHDFGHTDAEKFFVDFLTSNGIEATLENPELVLSIEIMQGIAYVGLNNVSEIISNQIPQRRKYEQRPINRAELKLREALEYFNVSLVSGKLAIDIGSAPGGWVKVLLEKGLEVIAIDPADLDERIRNLPKLTHCKCRAENFVTEKKAAIITNDMNLEPKDSARIMCGFAKYLEDSGICIMTIKFVTPSRRQLLSEAKSELEKEYSVLAIRKLPHNGYETTLLLRKK